MKNNNNKIKLLTYSSLFAAIIALTTAFVKIPLTSTGYVHIGDMFIYLLACLLPLPYAMCAAAIGGAVADIIAGYAVYSVFTFVIKALLCLAFTSATVRILSGRNIIGCLICLIITTGGYFLTDTLLFGTAAALGAVIFNLLQAVVSGVVFVVVAGILDKIGIKKIFML